MCQYRGHASCWKTRRCSGDPASGEASPGQGTLGQTSPMTVPWRPHLHLCWGLPERGWFGDVWKLTISVFTFHGNSETEEQASALKQVRVVLYGWPHVFHLPRSPLCPLCPLCHLAPAGTAPPLGSCNSQCLTLVWNTAYRAQESLFSSQDCLPCQAVLFLRSGGVSSYFLMTCDVLRFAPSAGDTAVNKMGCGLCPMGPERVLSSLPRCCLESFHVATGTFW